MSSDCRLKKLKHFRHFEKPWHFRHFEKFKHFQQTASYRENAAHAAYSHYAIVEKLTANSSFVVVRGSLLAASGRRSPGQNRER
jgi:hypothetical protein